MSRWWHLCGCNQSHGDDDEITHEHEHIAPCDNGHDELHEQLPVGSFDRSPRAAAPEAPAHLSPKSPKPPAAQPEVAAESTGKSSVCEITDGFQIPADNVTQCGSFHNLGKDIQKVLREADRLRADGYPFAAEALVHDLQQRLEKEGRQEDLEQTKVTQVYGAVTLRMQQVNGMLLTLLDDEGWTVQKENDGIHVWTRPEPGTDLVTVRIAGVLEGGFDYFCSVGKEVDLVKTWMTGVKVSYIHKQLGVFDAIGYYCWKIPLITGREFLVEEENLINDAQGYCVVRRGAPRPREGVDIPAVQKGYIRAAISNWCSFTAPVGVDKRGRKFIFCVTVMNVDLKIPLPTYLVNKLSITMGYNSFQQMRSNLKKAQEPKSPFYASVTNPENTPFYGRMKALEDARAAHPIGCLQEIIDTGWVKDPAERRRIFARSDGVLVPLAT